MRTIIVGQYISLDGVVEAPEEWHFPYVDENMFRALGEMNTEIDTMLLGRVTYDVFAASFANAPADDPIAAAVNGPDKVLVSTTTTDPVWDRTTVVGVDLAAQVQALKERDGRGILINGSISVCQALFAAGLVDELHLFIHPVVVGHGRRLFADDGPRIPLSVARAELFPTGTWSVRYRVGQ